MTVDELPAAFASLPASWRQRLPGWTGEAEARLIGELRVLSGTRPIAPLDPFRALRRVEPDDVRVVIFGQDPYPTAGHADGLAFSAGRGRPKSLQRIFEVLADDRPGWLPPAGGQLDDWADQGVLLLNPTLTVEVGRAGSHLASSWWSLTSKVVQLLLKQPDPPVFMLWGQRAQDFYAFAAPHDARATVLRSRHPSYDFKRQFMADGSHFLATQDRVDWWRLGC